MDCNWAHPKNEKSLLDLGDTTKLVCIENELKFYKERLSKIEGHPYMKLGLNIYRFIRRVREHLRSPKDEI